MFGWRKNKGITDDLSALINLAGQLGLSERYITVATEFIEHQEFALSFDQVVTQIYEDDVEINTLFYSMVTDIARKLELPANEYDFLLPLIKDKTS